MATLRHQIANIISVMYTAVRFTTKKIFYPRSFSFSLIERFSPNVVVDTDSKSKIKLGKRVSAHSGCRIVATNGGELTIGDRTSFNVNCIITCRNRIEIGNNVSFGPGAMLFDHDHTLDNNKGVNNTPFKLGKITIGDGSWIGAGVIILSGAKIGRNCIIAAGSIVKADVPDNTTLIQKRENTYKSVE